MYTTSLTHLGNISGNHEDGNNVYGAQFDEVEAMTPYYERSIHYLDKKPWINNNLDKTYNNYIKMVNEPKVKTYRELEFKAIPQDKYEFIEDFCGNGTCLNTKNSIKNSNIIYENIENMENNGIKIDTTMHNFYPKLISFLFVLFVLWKLI
jgi:hypothetical protein